MTDTLSSNLILLSALTKSVLLKALYTVGTESILNHLSSFFSSLMYTQHPILTEKHIIVDIFADLLKKKN